MLEIVHDLAPGAQLFFANAQDGTSLSFEHAVDFLAANTDVVVDDFTFFTPPFDGMSTISMNTAMDLNTDINPIRGYFTAVGNYARSHYEGQYVDSGRDGTSITGEAGHLHSFQAVPDVTKDNENFGPTIFDPLTAPPNGNGTVTVVLAWNDPTGASTNDYDLFLVPLACNGFDPKNALPLPPCTIAGAPVGFSTDAQTGSHDPTEVVSYQNPKNSPVALGIVIQNVNNQAAPKTFDLFVISALNGGGNPDHNFNTVSGSVPAEADAGGSPVSVVSVGATDVQIDANGNQPGTVIEPYSGQGPTEATQALSRMKPDVIAADGVSVTGAGDFGAGNNLNTAQCALGQTPCFFFGTSAAAPHAAAIAALVLQALSSSSVGDPATERANLRYLLTSTALPLPGVSGSPNNIEGFGLLDALSAVKAARVAASSFSLSPNPANVNIGAAGQSATSTITVTGIGGFAGSVSFTCSVSPVPVNDPTTCFVIPFSVALGATTTSATATLKISTTVGLTKALQFGNGPNRPDYFAATTSGIVMAWVFLLGAPKQRGRWTALLGLTVLVFLGVMLSSCAGGGGSSKINLGTPSGGYTVTVAASSGGTTRTTNVAVTVQ